MTQQIDESSLSSLNQNIDTSKATEKQMFCLSRNKIYPQKLPPISGKGKLKPFKSRDGFEIIWKNLSYVVVNHNLKSCFRKNDDRNVKAILKCLSGFFRSGELTAVMGPSGAGKSTLLSCVCGKRTTGVSGEIKVIGSDKIKVSVVDQEDHLLDKLSVIESITFSFKVNRVNQKDYKPIINNVVNILGLEKCLNTPIGKCSGGQKKRISIALELILRPNILILDEPTSGLDSATTFHLVKVLNELTHQKEPMAIVATIHQPSSRVFNLFSQVYVISKTGRCVYQGPPSELITTLSTVGLECPAFHNPADFIAEVASGDHGDDKITSLATLRQNTLSNHSEVVISQSISELARANNNYRFSWNGLVTFICKIWLLMKRSFTILPREPHLFTVRIISNISVGIVVGVLFGSEIGKASGCLPTQEELYSLEVDEIYNFFEKQQLKINENLGFIFFSCLYCMFSGLMPMVLVFPSEFNVFRKEYNNGWYSVTIYHLSKLLAELPMMVLSPNLYAVTSYLLTGQIIESWRFAIFCISLLEISAIGQMHGLMSSAIFSHNMVQAAFMGMMITIPHLLFSGFLVRYKTMPWYLKPISGFSFARYGFEAITISTYGFNRCKDFPFNSSMPEPKWLRVAKLMKYNQRAMQGDIELDDYDYQEDSSPIRKIMSLFSSQYNERDKKFDDFNSLVLSQLELSEMTFYWHTICLNIFLFVLIFITYFVLYAKVNSKK